jgi:hypothetical protein
MKINAFPTPLLAVATLLCAASNLVQAGSQVTFTDTWKDTGAYSASAQAYVTTSSSFKVNISLPLNGINLNQADSQSIFTLNIGPSGNTIPIISDTLGDADNYIEGKSTATWPLADPNSMALIGNVTVSWTATTLTVTCSASESGYGTEDVLGEEQTFAGASTGTPYSTNLNTSATGVFYEVSVVLDTSDDGGEIFANDFPSIPVTGSDKETEYNAPDGSGLYPVEAGSITGTADLTPPVVTITSPTANAKFNDTPAADTIIELKGTASDSVGVTNIEVYVDDDFNNPIAIDQETNLPKNSVSWTLSLDLTQNPDAQPGFNIITVVAMDAVGNQASVSRTIQWIEANTAMVTINPPDAGTVKGITSGESLIVGDGYAVTATPASKSWIFAGWTDKNDDTFPSASSFIYLDTVDTGGSLIANFLANPFNIDLAGTYTGLFFDTNNNVEPTTSGYITVTVTTAGAYSGKLYLADPATSFAISGQLGLADGGSIATATAPLIKLGKSQFLSVNLQISTDTNLSDQTLGSLGGSVNVFTDVTETNLVWTEGIMGELSLNNTNVALGLYNVVMQPISSDPSQGPGGYGFVSATVAKNGAVALVINLPDGTSPAISFSSSLAQDGTCPFYTSLYGGKGVILGWLQFATDGSGTVQGSSVNWVKLPVADKFYTSGFTATPTLSGALYVPPKAGINIFGWTAGVLITDQNPSGWSVTFNPVKNTFTGPKGLAISLTATTGALTVTASGPLLPAGSSGAITAHGVVLPASDSTGGGYGSYTLGGETWPFTIGDAPAANVLHHD